MISPVFEAAGGLAFEAMPCLATDHPFGLPAVALRRGFAAGSSPAHGLARPFVGFEAQPGVVPEATLLLLGPAVESSSAHASFESLSGAVAFVAEAKRVGVVIGRVELLDAPLAAALTRRGALRLGARPTLFFEFHGEAEVVNAAGDEVEDLLEAHGGDALNWASNPVAAAWLWQVRRGALAWACTERRSLPSRTAEVRVPIPHLAETVEGMRADAEAAGVTAYILGDVGKGSVQCVFAHAPGEEAIVQSLSDRIALRAMAAAGMVTGGSAAGFGTREPGRADTARRRSVSGTR